MSAADPLTPLYSLGSISSLASDATARIARVHRRPAALRKTAVIASESALRGARLSTLIDGHVADPTTEPDGDFGRSVSVYSLLAPEKVAQASATLLRAPAQVAARMDVLAGGRGVPVTADGAERLRTLGAVISHSKVSGVLATQVVHAEIAAHRIFGDRSELIARAMSRLMAVASGFDPSGIAVPEVHLHRHRARYREVLDQWTDAGNSGVTEAIEFLVQAWIAGADEGDSIVLAA